MTFQTARTHRCPSEMKRFHGIQDVACVYISLKEDASKVAACLVAHCSSSVESCDKITMRVLEYEYEFSHSRV
jgi:hypothetical protein